MDGLDGLSGFAQLLELVFRFFLEVVCYWTGKLVISPFGYRVSLGDECGIRRRRTKAGGRPKIPIVYRQSDQRFMRSDTVQLIGMATLVLLGVGIAAFYLLLTQAR